ncbi:D-alanine transaminase [Oceanobacillus limi]|uniref:D-alanine aminotransferase n=1 Tax=Oceanobacillus limi TaxID=930131 RepID=A0A1H9YFN0_9BACI|nr:D-amino-acid transaminase [Oceanobacillus limi]SES67804.1 D-alanine transaminase [Oceanobacillus limi]
MSVYPVVLSQTKLIHRDSVKYPMEERALQFGDGVYEVIRVYHGNYYLLTEHVDRLYRSAEAIKIDIPFSKDTLTNLLNELLERNNINDDAKVYLQISRGSAPRDHAFPTDVSPNFYAYVQKMPRNMKNLENGVAVITHEDDRWQNCYIKSLNLLPNVIAKQAAHEKGCYEAILHKGGLVTECSAANVYLVKDGKIYTHPTTRNILYGCVRLRIEAFTKNLGIPLVEEAFTLKDIETADELFLSSSTSEVLPIIAVDAIQIANGKPQKITKQLQQAYEEDAKININPGNTQDVKNTFENSY